MAPKLSSTAIILFATFTLADFVRVRPNRIQELEESEERAHIIAQNDGKGSTGSVIDDRIDKSFEDGAAGTVGGPEANSADAPTLAMESPAVLVQEDRSAAPNEPSSTTREVQSAKALVSTFSMILDYMRAANPVSQVPILKAACDSHAFSCAEIVQLAGNSSTLMKVPWHGEIAVDLFAAGRNNTGCISDPINAQSIFDFYASKFPLNATIYDYWGKLREMFINNDGLKPAKGVGAAPVQLQIGLRTDKHMEQLLGEMKELLLIKTALAEGGDVVCDFGHRTPEEFVSWMQPMYDEFLLWLSQIGPDGEQFSGPQLVALVNAIPELCMSPQLVSTLLGKLEQHLTGVTCEEVIEIIPSIVPWIKREHFESGETKDSFFFSGLTSLKQSITDGQNKFDIIAFVDKLFFQRYPEWQWPIPLENMVKATAYRLRDVGVGLLPKNNPVFGLVKGNPVVFVIDESTAMDASFLLGDDILTRRKYCNAQLEAVLRRLPNGTYFNLIQYSSSTVTIFKEAVLASNSNIDAAMLAMGTTWRGDYKPEQDPLEMLGNIIVFALKLKHKLNQSIKRNSMEALQMGYAAAHLPSHKHSLMEGNGRHIDLELINCPLHVHRGRPQIYLLTSGQPDSRASSILRKTKEFDKGRNIPVNTIAFITPADLVARKFAKNLAHTTGGFFRSIEQSTLCTNKRKREPGDESIARRESNVHEGTHSRAGQIDESGRKLMKLHE